MCPLVLMMVDESSSLVVPVGESFSIVFMSGDCSMAVWMVTSIRFSVIGVVSVCLVLENTSLLTWRF
jgi:hypothetical protein